MLEELWGNVMRCKASGVLMLESRLSVEETGAHVETQDADLRLVTDQFLTVSLLALPLLNL